MAFVPNNAGWSSYDEYLAKFNSLQLIHFEMEKYELSNHFRNENIHVVTIETENHYPYADEKI